MNDELWKSRTGGVYLFYLRTTYIEISKFGLQCLCKHGGYKLKVIEKRNTGVDYQIIKPL